MELYQSIAVTWDALSQDYFGEYLVYGIGVGSLGSVLPEIILLIGGLLVLILDMAQNSETSQRETGRGFMAISVLFLFVGLLAVLLQWNMAEHSAFDMVDIDPVAAFFKFVIYTSMLLVAVAGGSYMNRNAPYLQQRSIVDRKP